METIRKDEFERCLREFLRERLEEITNPVNFAYGYETRPGAEARLIELKLLARRFGLLDLCDDIDRAIKPIRAWIENQLSRGLPTH